MLSPFSCGIRQRPTLPGVCHGLSLRPPGTAHGSPSQVQCCTLVGNDSDGSCFPGSLLLRRNFDFTLRALHFTNTIQPKMQKTGLFMQTGLSSCMRYLQYSGIRWFLHLHPLGPILFPLCGHKPRRNSYHPAIWQPQSVRHSFPLPGVQSHVHRRPWP